ncbi:Shedu anti-phage system protein SduA domain-containing protein [Pseudarthrobacter phenanthrenivorans]|uniref:Shedu anti-phage system protein SduA domain-containing protein n=1 Tax=Pseudarthrobacter phenanthrenivorans TaxID=361575 RepID=UPI002F35FAB4
MIEEEPAMSAFPMAPEPDSTPQRPRPMEWTNYSDQVMSEWYALLSTDPDEPAVQKFLELHPAMIPGGSGDIGPGGHHGSQLSAVFRLPTLTGAGRAFEPDFMWVTKSSGLITPIVIEIEKPSKRWFLKSGRPSAEFTAAHDQLNDWRSWFDKDSNKALFRQRYMFDDLHNNRPLKPQFLLIYGRESEFGWGGGHASPDEMRHKRDSRRAADEFFMTFDALRPRYDHANSVTVTMTAKGPKPFAFSPMYSTHAETGLDAKILGDPTEALDRSVMMSEERRAYLAGRWKYWQEVESKHDPNRSYIRSMGLE